MDNEERLQRIIAAAGLASRRKAELLIEQGRVAVNGKTVTRLGAKADPRRDHIKVDGKLIRNFPRKVYVLLNKPPHVISSVMDPQRRTKVTDLVDLKTKIYPVGRLDYDTEGIILLTNDGEFSKIVTSGGEHLPKVYHVRLSSMVEEKELSRLRKGIRLPNGTRLRSCKIVPLRKGTESWYEVTLTQGKNRQIRQMFEATGHIVLKLRRTKIGFLTAQGLAVGCYRFLAPREIERILKLGHEK